MAAISQSVMMLLWIINGVGAPEKENKETVGMAGKGRKWWANGLLMRTTTTRK